MMIYQSIWIWEVTVILDSFRLIRESLWISHAVIMISLWAITFHKWSIVNGIHYYLIQIPIDTRTPKVRSTIVPSSPPNMTVSKRIELKYLVLSYESITQSPGIYEYTHPSAPAEPDREERSYKTPLRFLLSCKTSLLDGLHPLIGPSSRLQRCTFVPLIQLNTIWNAWISRRMNCFYLKSRSDWMKV